MHVSSITKISFLIYVSSLFHPEILLRWAKQLTGFHLERSLLRHPVSVFQNFLFFSPTHKKGHKVISRKSEKKKNNWKKSLAARCTSFTSESHRETKVGGEKCQLRISPLHLMPARYFEKGERAHVCESKWFPWNYTK